MGDNHDRKAAGAGPRFPFVVKLSAGGALTSGTRGQHGGVKIFSSLRLFGFGLICFVLFFSLPSAQAGSATWKLNPPNGFWTTATNWSPATVPNGAADVATFGVTNFSAISGMSSIVGEIVYTANASS